MLFKPFNQSLSCHDSKLTLVFLKEQLISWQIDFIKIRHKNVEYFNLVHVQKPKFTCRSFLRFAIPNSFLAPFLSFVWPVYSRYFLHVSVVFFLAAVKSLVLIMGKAWKWDLDQLYRWVLGAILPLFLGQN